MKIIDLRNGVAPAAPVNWPGWMYPGSGDDTSVLDHVKAHPLADYRLEAAVLVSAGSPDGMIAGQEAFGIAYSAAGSSLQLVNETTSGSGVHEIAAEPDREYHVVLERRDGTMRIVLDGVEVRRADNVTNNDLAGWTGAMMRRTGVVRTCCWTDLDSGEVIFDYPESESVAKNLLFRTGARIVDGAFERDNAAVPMRLTSRVDLRNYGGDLTLWADVLIDPAQQGGGALRSYGLFGQGEFLGSASQTLLNFAIQTQSSGSWYLLCTVSNGTTLFGAAGAATQIGRAEAVGRHRYALTLDRAANQLKGYIDGELKWTQTPPVSFGPLNPGMDWSGGVAIGNGSDNASDYRIYGAMMFGRTLSADEIRSLA